MEEDDAEPFITGLRDDIARCVLWTKVLLVTVCMAYSETTNITFLALYSMSLVSLVMLELHTLFYDVAGWWPSLAVATLAASLFVYMRMFLRKVNDMERVGEKYSAVDRSLGLKSLKKLEKHGVLWPGREVGRGREQVRGRASSQLQLGPLQVLKSDLRQPESVTTLGALLWKSAELGSQFETRVLLPLYQSLPPESLASSTVPTFNLKTAKRCREKTRLEYDGDFRQLKDTLRGSIICRDIADVGSVWKALKQLQADGVLEVLQVKNRYRGPPMPGGYRDININVRFDGIICEIQMHTAGHYALKKELHPSYKLCRSVGLVGDIEVFDRNGIRSQRQSGAKHLKSSRRHYKSHNSRLVPKVGIVVLKCCFALFLSIFGGMYASLHAFEYKGEKGGWVQCWQGLSLAIPCWLLAFMFVVDIWDKSRAAFAGLLLNIALALICWYFWAPRFFWDFANVIVLAFVPFVILCWASRWRGSRRGSKEEKCPRIALLYSLYFGVDGTYFALKSAIQQCLTVWVQAHVKLNLVGTLVSGPFSMAVYWMLFAVLVGNSILPPLMLSSSTPWVRREGAMAFDVACDLVYTVGVNFFYMSHTFSSDAIVPVDIMGYMSLVSPCLRILSVVRVLEETSWATLGNSVDPSRLSRKAAMGFGLLSLAGFGLALALMAADRDVYPWNANVCRPCQCSDELVLEQCNYEGQNLVLTRRGITGIKAGALNDAADVKGLRLMFNDIETLPPSAFDGVSGLEVINLSYNKIELLEAGALRNLTQLKELWLVDNFLSSLEDFNGALIDLAPSLELLDVKGNDVTCEDLRQGLQSITETWVCLD
jgi:hypothetical protein